MEIKLDGKVAIVTGSIQGIGLEIAKTLAKSGAAVVINNNVDQVRLDAAADEIRADGGRVEAVIADVTKKQEAQKLGVPIITLTQKDRITHIGDYVFRNFFTPQMLVKALDASIQQVKSGAPAAQMSIAMNKVISDADYAKYCYPPYMRARGHGIGVGSIAPGTVIDDDTDGTLERDQVIVIHPNQYFPETGYLACGETFLVTNTGFERLSDTEAKLYIKAV